MRIIINEFESDSAVADYYDFQDSVLKNVKTEPLFLRHEYFENEQLLKQSLYLFGRRSNEHGAQVFIHLYPDYLNNLKYNEDLAFYENQKKNFRLTETNTKVSLNLLPEIKGGVSNDLLTTKDGKYRKRVLYNIKGNHDSMLLVFSLDSNEFSEILLFNFVRDNFKIEMR